MRKPMAVTPQKLVANWRNAQKSTGPKTPKGRAVSRMNAFKHGILSKEVVVRGRCIKECEQEFFALRQRFWEDCNPVGVQEEMLVDQIVTSYWRLHRVLKAESGAIALNVDKGNWDRTYQHPVVDTKQWEMDGDPVWPMRHSVFGNFILEKKLKEVRASVEKEGELTEAAIQSAFFHGEPNSLTRDLAKLRLRSQENPEGFGELAFRAKQKNQILAYIDKELDFISWHKPECEEHEELEEVALQRAALLPSSEVLDKFMRYETMLRRQLRRDMNQLERLQRRWQGEMVPPPITMEVLERY